MIIKNTVILLSENTCFAETTMDMIFFFDLTNHLFECKKKNKITTSCFKLLLLSSLRPRFVDLTRFLSLYTAAESDKRSEQNYVTHHYTYFLFNFYIHQFFFSFSTFSTCTKTWKKLVQKKNRKHQFVTLWLQHCCVRNKRETVLHNRILFISFITNLSHSSLTSDLF